MILSLPRRAFIAGAMLDVYEHYRLAPGHPLFGLDNSGFAAAAMLRMLTGEPPLNFVNPESRRLYLQGDAAQKA